MSTALDIAPGKESAASAVRLIEISRQNGVIEQAVKDIHEAIKQGLLTPLSTMEAIRNLMTKSEAIRTIFGAIFRLSGKDDFEDPPPAEEFEVLEQGYIGADGRARKPLPKYVPIHINTAWGSMKKDYSKMLSGNADPNDKKRPGLIVESGYRSPGYQAALLTRAIKENGFAAALMRIMLPGQSQHGDYENGALDVTNIGDKNGKIVPFEQTPEFLWLLENAERYNFWFPYSPDPDDLMNETSIVEGVAVEPWHLQYRPDAAKMMHENRTKEAFRARIKLH